MIDRRVFIKSTGLAIGLSAFSNLRFLNALLDQSGYQMTALRNNVGIFTERGGTIGWMMAEEGIVIVDSQFPTQAQHLVEEIQKKADRSIDLLINTHHHGDHSAGNIVFKGLADKVVAHENSMKNQKRVAESRGTSDSQLLPDTTYREGTWHQKVGNETVRLHYFGAAHTNGDSIIHFENANIAHMGDLVFNRRVPYIDKSSGADIGNWQSVMDKAYQTFDGDTLFVFGHSGEGYEITGKRDDLMAFKNYLARVMEFVKKGAEAGKSKQEMADATSIPGAEEWKGNQARAVNAAYMELFEEQR